jgi:hypothetical protein
MICYSLLSSTSKCIPFGEDTPELWGPLGENYYAKDILFRLYCFALTWYPFRVSFVPSHYRKSRQLFSIFFFFLMSRFFFFFWHTKLDELPTATGDFPLAFSSFIFHCCNHAGLFAWQFKIWHDEHQRSLDVDNTISMEGFTPKAIKASCPGRYHGKSFYCDKRKKKVQSHRKYCERDRFGRKSVVRFQTWFDPNTTVSISRAGDWNTQGITVQLSMYLRTTREKGALSRFEKNNI